MGGGGGDYFCCHTKEMFHTMLSCILHYIKHILLLNILTIGLDTSYFNLQGSFQYFTIDFIQKIYYGDLILIIIQPYRLQVRAFPYKHACSKGLR